MARLKSVFIIGLLALAWNLDIAGAQSVRLVGDALTELDPNGIVVGQATDVIVEVECVSGEMSPWLYENGTTVDSGRTAFGVSQEDGILRLFPVSLLNDASMFQCNGSTLIDVQFQLVDSLFFTDDLPISVNRSAASQFINYCSVPDTPLATSVSVNNATVGYLSCEVETERGAFSSGTVAIVDPEFLIEPVDIIVPTEESSRAAFACSVTPDEYLASIEWYFEAGPGSGMGPELVPEMDPNENITIVEGGPDPGTSILVLSGDAAQQEGMYICTVTFQDGDMLTSNASLTTYSSLGSQDVILSPPATLTVQLAEGLRVPCVNSSVNSIDFNSITTDDAGQHFCGAVMFTIEVLVPLTFTEQPDSEVVVWEGDEVTLTCNATGYPAPDTIQWLSDNVIVEASGTYTIAEAMREDSGIYQCEAQVNQIRSVTHTYLNVHFLGEIDITPFEMDIILEQEDTPDTVTINCSVEANPLPRITLEWYNGVRGELVQGKQAPTGFMESAFSLLTVNTSELRGREEFNCTVTLDDVTRTNTSVVNAYTPVNITEDPSPSEIPLPVGETATLSCEARSIPSPVITWFRDAANGEPEEILSMSFPNIMVGDIENLPDFTNRVTIDVTVTADDDFTAFFCGADNGFNSTNSTATTLILAGVPGSVAPVTVTDINTTQVTVAWQNASSQIPILEYVVTVFNLDVEELVIHVEAGTDDFNNRELFLMNLSPATAYTVTVAAVNGAGSGPNETVMFDTLSIPQFLFEPVEFRAAVSEIATFRCAAIGVSLPNITWEDASGATIANDGVFMINTTAPMDPQLGDNVSSVLEFVVTLGMNGSEFRCVACNEVGRNESELAPLLVGGVPGSVAPIDEEDVMAREATISWQSPVSILPVTNYRIEWFQIDSEMILNDSTIPGNTTTFTIENLKPARSYNVTVFAINRVGNGPRTSVIILTNEAAPTAPPMNVMTSAPQFMEIAIMWDPPPEEAQNGVITGYTVYFSRVGSTMSDSRSTTMTSLTLGSLEADATYLISVVAETSVGPGPHSQNVSQMTLSPLPDISDEPLVQVDGTTTTTIPFQIPEITETFSHIWVIILRLNTTSDIDLSESPRMEYPDNRTFTSYSSNVPAGKPYIAAEIGSADVPETYILGDESQVNDLPELYRNGPLEEGTLYTAFIWVFVPRVPDGETMKRQASLLRQYDAFSSSPFLSAVATAVGGGGGDGGLEGGAIAGIVIAILIFLAVLAVLVVILFLRFGIPKVKKLAPPPSRTGSMRLRQNREVVLTNIKTGPSELQDLSPDDVRLAVTLEEFEAYVKKMHANTDHLFSEEYEILTIKSPNLAHLQCSMPFNVQKNRYANINCYDESRVHLNRIPGVDGSDYINANYIHGYQKSNAYVATQGPLPNTTYDFWRMVWELNSCCIIILTNLVEKSRAKCHQYWPEAGSVSFGDMTVTLIDTQELAYYTIRTFRMNRGNDRREVKQFHYTAWPDFGVPDHPNPVITFMRRISNYKRIADGPDIMHCSAGVGRTGTLISIQSMIQMMSEEGKIDIFNFVLDMRMQRNYMVQTERQYIFVHDALMEIIKVGDTEIPIQSLRRRFKEMQAQDPDSELSKLEEEFLLIQDLNENDKTQLHSAKMTVNLPKNRDPDILPYDAYRVRLLMHPGVSGSDYINASYVDGYQRRHQYIVTQGPLKHTVDDFWRMVWEHRASTILMLCKLEERGKEQCARYWPTDKIRQHADLFVETTQEQEFATYTMREFSITNTKINESRLVKHYQYVDWQEGHCPTNAAAIIDLIGVLQKTQHQCGGGPIILHGSTPIGRAGTFCVLSNVLEQLKVEGIVDLFFTVHSLRQQQPGLIKSFDQYKFCYTAVLEFLDSFDHYANFD